MATDSKLAPPAHWPVVPCPEMSFCWHIEVPQPFRWTCPWNLISAPTGGNGWARGHQPEFPKFGLNMQSMTQQVATYFLMISDDTHLRHLPIHSAGPPVSKAFRMALTSSASSSADKGAKAWWSMAG